MLFAYVLDDPDRGIEAGRDLVVFYGSAPAYASLFSKIGYGSQSRAMTAAWKEKDRDAVKRAVTAGMVNTFTVLGSIQDLRERVEEYHEAGIDDVFICPTPFGDYQANIEEILGKYDTA
jgi:alkanesulfonate monooxygenase SsuD/methylene tetrahydromethanopterin reductase-like flavin-dependent oxidoreductase (luciferase family)